MVDVSSKSVTVREALAVGDIVMDSETAEMIRAGQAKKGDVLGVARLAAIQSTKLTPQLIPLCHAIPVEAVAVEFVWSPFDSSSQDTASSQAGSSSQASSSSQAILRCRVRVRTSAKTGVEMEAMMAVSVACLTVYDMVKSVDRGLTIGPLQLLEKSGGKSGLFRRS